MAQEREKRRIVIASILKPVDDTRMLEKIGLSLARKDGFDVSIIGYATTSPSVNTNIRLISLGHFPRLSLRRWLSKWVVLRKAWALQPTHFIFTTHELILPAIILKVAIGTHIIYDVRENFYRNIRNSESLPWLARIPLAMLVRFKEKLLAPTIDHFFLAEKAYEKEFRFHRGGWTVLENKALIPAGLTRTKIPGKTRLLFSGTLCESTGVFRAIQLGKQLHAQDPNVTLTIAGYASIHSVRDRIAFEAANSPFIQLVGVNVLVPHEEIVKQIFNADAGIIAYSSASHTENSVPTKLFEYLTSALPIILENKWPWIQQYEGIQPFITCDFLNLNPASLLASLKSNVFYTTPATDASWKSEEPKLLTAIKNIV